MKLQSLIITVLMAFLCSACQISDKVTYFQSDSLSETHKIGNSNPISIKPNDQISITVNVSNQKYAGMYNLPSAWLSNKAYNDMESNYTVDHNGNIDFPVLGTIHVAGLTRKQIAELVKNKLETSVEGVKDPTVTVEFINLYYSVLGEVNKQGRYKISRDEFTVLDALSAAGDLTIYGKRGNVKVMRNNDGEMMVYEINLTDSKSIYTSPAFYIQQNDVIYVEPNKVRARQSTANGNSFVSASFWLSIASVLITMGMYLVKW